MIRNLFRVLGVVLLGAGVLVACSDDQQACAATITAPAAKPGPPSSGSGRKSSGTQPGSTRTTSKIQDKTGTGSTGSSTRPRATTTINPNWKSTTKPTTWSGYNTGNRNWSKPYRSGYPVAPQPVIVNVYHHDYRTYGGYPGYYPVGVWPVGYGAHYGCVAEREAAPEQTPSPAPTVTIIQTPGPTVTVTAQPSTTPSATPTETPR